MNPHKVRGKVNPKTAASALRRASSLRPKLAIVLGSGFHATAKQANLAVSVPYTKLAGFTTPSVHGHAGQALIGHLGGTEIIILQGRAHYYEGHSMAAITLPIRVLAEYGIKCLLITNAAGGINSKYQPGEFMAFKDHLNFMGDNPLRGPAKPGLERFVDLTQAYDPSLTKTLQLAARKNKIKLHTGVYCAVSGPNYETPAEVRAYGKLGADAVGMSTVPEAIVARHCGLRVAALSCITNSAAGLTGDALTHDEVLSTGATASQSAGKLLTEFASRYE
ncbi:MAG: purine-nucleoside phosphorylase [Limisphaerales bacterium]|nr:MAG: purine-nucleoside phosphorylase [Limisphaerales bacterium]